MEKGEIKAKGVFDPVQIQKRLEKLCKKKIELVSPKIQIKETPVVEKKIVKETKEVRCSLSPICLNNLLLNILFDFILNNLPLLNNRIEVELFDFIFNCISLIETVFTEQSWPPFCFF